MNNNNNSQQSEIVQEDTLNYDSKTKQLNQEEIEQIQKILKQKPTLSKNLLNDEEKQKKWLKSQNSQYSQQIQELDGNSNIVESDLNTSYQTRISKISDRNQKIKVQNKKKKKKEQQQMGFLERFKFAFFGCNTRQY
ncbi:hypothetical protein PPERSA_05135 [Pseudocohnilembus persalinus]|uniref:Uncharacterized protein n=1 Tax=Pseudocohnilembus persalinus TaxID=266149 RepID=A0A0V0QWT9_PSEPJ|nr:hypothetical protein PPERSA_05135 [Pseudocohnilembus persalinus]|eukprot:KRX06522.1 hypothetical protein PPERSA_05135 [Pseudocohnilembus persalinus]